MGKVIRKKGKIVRINSKEIRLLKKKLKKSPDKKARICLHSGFDDPLQEMLIIHGRGAYVRPHKHISKDETISIIEGRGLLLIFSEKGKVEKALSLNSESSKGNFVCRIGKGVWHSMMIISDSLVFHEVSSGPFIREEQNVFPEWSPSEEETDEIKKFMKCISAGRFKP